MREIINVKLGRNSHQYSIKVGHNILKSSGLLAKTSFHKTARKIVVVTNAKVFLLFGEDVVKSLENEGFEVFVWQIGDGEKYKNVRSFEKTINFFSNNNLSRNDGVVALGGGVVGDLAGFAAAVYLRGISFLQVPTTLLSMIDSSVGGKTGINSTHGKNSIGAFHQPNGVLIDVAALRTLSRRELTSGFCEAVRQAAIANKRLFNQTKDFLEIYALDNFERYFLDRKFLENLQRLITAHISFKAEIVKGDEKENLSRKDKRSRKILNFGHTFAHALEKVTNYKYFKHGEAVGYGILAAGEISKNLGIFSKARLKLLYDAVQLTGELPNSKNIEADKVIEALIFDKKNLGDSLQWILLEEIGSPKIVSNTEIPFTIIRNSIEKVLKGLTK